MLTVSSSPPVIELDNVSKTYGSGETLVHALWNVSLEIVAGEYCAIMGASGSGKSTAMSIIGCLDRPSAGICRLEGTDVASLDEDQLAQIRNQKLGFVFQQFYLLPQLTALENVMLPMIYAQVPREERRDRAIVALTQMGLQDRLHNKPNQLSGGQQQRVAIARAIVNQPVLLLADEPTGALDSQTTEEVLKIFEMLNGQGITLVIVTHEPDVAARAQRVIWFRDGEILRQEYHQRKKSLVAVH
jgi:putative ABC transport system ATP-binding protein